jgi:tRNA pseudouridine55 synthase
MANNPPKRQRVPLHGVLLLDKHAGISSNDVLVRAKRLLNAQKAGHTGTLDPFATGLLPLCFGEATKFAQDLLDADKTYETVLHLGRTTTTGDTEGEVLAELPVDTDIEAINGVLGRFRGPISQVPPMYSALKRDGRPLYEYARAGITLEREARDVIIHSLDMLAYEAPYLTLRVKCSKGTYVRVLGEDIGAALGCGAHLKSLRRTQVGNLSIDYAISLEALTSLEESERPRALAPVDALLSTFEAVRLPDALATRFSQGQRLVLEREGVPSPVCTGRVRVYRASTATLLGTAVWHAHGVLAPERLMALS